MNNKDQYRFNLLRKAVFKTFSERKKITQSIENWKGEKFNYVLSGDDIAVRLFYESKIELQNVVARIQIKNQFDEVVTTLNNYHCDNPFKIVKDKGSFLCKIPKIPFFEGVYKMDFSCLQHLEIVDHIISAGELIVEEGDFHGTGRLPKDKRGILLKNNWENCDDV